jgi:lipopolysaccharide export system protein LptC
MALSLPDNLHSRLVFWLKILLPFVALVLLSTLFLFSRSVSPEDAVPYAEVDVADRLRAPRITAPDFSGMTSDGAALALKADEVRLATDEGDNPGAINTMSGVLDTPDGGHTTLTAATAVLDRAANSMQLGGGVQIVNALGYVIDATGLSVALDRTRLDSTDGPITADGPAGTIIAGSMHLGLADPVSQTYLLVFNGGVRMIYRPGTQGAGQ